MMRGARSHCFGRFALAVASAVALLDVASAGAQADCIGRSTIAWTPVRPRAGSLFDVTVRTPSMPAGVAITVAGVPLHASSDGSMLARADAKVDATVDALEGAIRTPRRADTRFIAAAPLDSVSGITLRVTCEDGTPLELRIPTDSGRYRLERLRVAPRFSAPPDSALAERMRVEAERAAAVSQQSHETPRLWRAPFVVPRTSRITSAFGSGRTFNGAVVSRHTGTDYAGAVGAPVRASNRGIVRLVGSFYLGGNVVYLDHGAGLVTAYLHLSRTLVAVGDTVARGGVLGQVGATGRVTGPHLHFIARYGGITVDPLTLIGRR